MNRYKQFLPVLAVLVAVAVALALAHPGGPLAWAQSRIASHYFHDSVAVVFEEIDFSTDNLGADEEAQLFLVPAKSLVDLVAAECYVAEGGTATVDIGDYEDADCATAISATYYMSNFDMNTADNVYPNTGVAGADLAALRKFYEDAAYIGLHADHALDAGTIKVWARITPQPRR